MAFYIQFLLNDNVVYEFMLQQANPYISIGQNGEINVNAIQLLRDNGITIGKYNYYLYIIQKFPVIQNLTIKKISSNKKQLQLQYSLENQNEIELLEENITSTEVNDFFILIGNLYCNVISNLKLYSLKDMLYIRTQQDNNIQLPASVIIYKLLYGRYENVVQLIYTISDEVSEYIQIGAPNFYEVDLNGGHSLVGKNLSNIYSNTSSILSKKLISSHTKQDASFVDYSTFSNFVYYGGATNRVDAFVNKISQVYQQFSNVSFSSNKTYSVVYYQKILNLYNNKLNQVVYSFDGYERYLFSTYPKTYINTSSIQKFQMIITQPSIANSTFANWYAPLYTASVEYQFYSGSNRLYNTIPEFLKEDSANYEYIKFIDMVGNYFDNIKLDIDAISAINSKNQKQLISLNETLLSQIFGNYDLQLVKAFNTEQLQKIYLQYLSILNISSYDTTFTFEKYNKEVWVRFISNIYYLLKSRGTKECIYSILNIFGINKNIINVKQFTGYNNDRYVQNFHTTLNTKLIQTDVYGNKIDLGSNQIVLLDYYYNPSSNSDSGELLDVNDDITLYTTNGGIVIKTLSEEYDLKNTKSGHYSTIISPSSITSYYLDRNVITLISQTSQLFLDTSQLNLKIYSSSFQNYLNINTIRAISQDELNNIYQYVKYYNYLNTFDLATIYYDFTSPSNFLNGKIYNKLNKVDDSWLTYQPTNRIYEYVNDGMIYYNPIFNLALWDDPVCEILTQSAESITLSYKPMTNSIKIKQNVNQNNRVFIGMDSAQYLDQQTLRFFGSYKLENLINVYGQQTSNEYKTLNQYNSYYLSNVRTNTYSVNSQITLLQNFDNSVFKVIKSFMPSTCDSYVGMFIRNPMLYRNKVQSFQSVESYIPMLQSNISLDYASVVCQNNFVQTMYAGQQEIANVVSQINDPLTGIANNSYQFHQIFGQKNNVLQPIEYYTYQYEKSVFFTDKSYTIPIYYDKTLLSIEVISDNIQYDMYNYRDRILQIGEITEQSVLYITSSIQRKILVDGQKKLTITTI